MKPNPCIHYSLRRIFLPLSQILVSLNCYKWYHNKELAQAFNHILYVLFERWKSEMQARCGERSSVDFFFRYVFNLKNQTNGESL